MPLRWERLHLPAEENQPPLLFNYTSNSEQYDLYITDLTHLWTEQLNRKAILKRADETNTTIDPSEDPEQFNVLLQKIEEALRGSPGSSVALNHARNGDSLELVLLTKLPAPLKPLKWSSYLTKQPHSSSTEQLLLPLLREAAGFEARERTLLDHIKQKDWVLAKLFDKVETMGIDLSTVFPGTSGLRAGRKGTTLAQAGKYIKGVAPFEEQAWFDEVSKSSPESGLAANIVAEISGAEKPNMENLSVPRDKWWNKLPRQGTTPTIAMDEEAEEEQEDQQPETPRDEMEIDTDAGEETEDEFERQETPPRLKQHKKTEESSPRREEKKKQKQARESPSPPPRQPPEKPSKPMGVIGGKKQTKKPSPTPSPEPEPEPEQAAADEETASDSDSQRDISPAPLPTRQKEPEPEPPKPKKPGGLGIIGGKKKKPSPKPPSPSPPPAPSPESTDSEAAPSAAPASVPSPPKKRPGKLDTIGGKKKDEKKEEEEEEKKEHPPSQEPSPRKPTTKLGVIGGKAAKHKQPPPPPSPSHAEEPLSPRRNEVDDQSKSPSPSPAKIKRPKPEPEPEKEETEQEKADRKREELKRQLEAKSKAPAKKKRKF